MKQMKRGAGETCTFGVHLTLDGYGGNPEKLNDPELVRKALDELPGKMGMEKMTEPVVHYAEPRNMKDSGGYSGFVMIVESHISIHTFPKKKFVSIDAYTCRDEMDKDTAVKYFKEMFDLEDTEVRFFKRGLKFPRQDLV
ncbi:MAG: adenosylmethionine decarboxylase [Candidatus Moranbacteria bacterium CG06_land_8_20_14_3_00_43_56]|nr:MAG: adenosylmethionine decarboxylase [Candidatus Moranbacteria bacterium CG06_land_8_20_14_3_00_43_56]PIV84533.1 MAG: adenosylmethionine decarboxylase [Candidatus Moranbacteria bacterium CG17_big_fil_post_rev_8_21_14_2_50_44_12]PJA86253.1 MAG: adenosylmethionine decarboxylase [Candidatus Moranbacteria bacterium CG_4_9_14_3_um_filter_44_28]